MIKDIEVVKIQNGLYAFFKVVDLSTMNESGMFRRVYTGQGGFYFKYGGEIYSVNREVANLKPVYRGE